MTTVRVVIDCENADASNFNKMKRLVSEWNEMEPEVQLEIHHYKAMGYTDSIAKMEDIIEHFFNEGQLYGDIKFLQTE